MNDADRIVFDKKGTDGDDEECDARRLPSVQLAASTREQACALLVHAIHHLLFAKGQVDQPISILRKRRERERQLHSSTARRHFTARRRDRKVDELLQATDEIERQIRAAIEQRAALRDATTWKGKEKARDDDVDVLIRIGQSPLTLPKQQFLVRCAGILSLPVTSANTAGKSDNGQMLAAPTRKAFGTKSHLGQDKDKSHVPSAAQDIKKLQALERKIVRFLLTSTSEDNTLGRALNKSIRPCKSQVLVAGPSNGYPPSWIPRPTLRLAARDFDESSSKIPIGKQQTHERESSPDTSATVPPEDLQHLVESLSPVKRRRMVLYRMDSDEDRGLHPTQDQSASPLPRAEETTTSPKRPSPAQYAVAGAANGVGGLYLDFEEKRIARLRARQLQKANVARDKVDNEAHGISLAARPHIRRAKRSKDIVSGAFVLDFSVGPHTHRDSPTAPQDDMMWHASRVVIRGLSST